MTGWLLGMSVAAIVVGWGLRRWRTRVPAVVWGVVELLPVALAFGASWCAVFLFSDLVGLEKQKQFAGLAAASACLPALPVALMWPRYRGRVLVLVLSALAFLLLSDVVYFRFFGGIVPLLAASSAGLLWDITDSIRELMHAPDWALVLVLFPGAVVAVVWPLPPMERKPHLAWQVLSILICTGACAAGAAPVQVDVTGYLKLSRSWKVFDVADNLKYAGVLVSHARDIGGSLRERDEAEVLSEQQLSEVRALADERVAERTALATLPSFGALRGRNMVVIQLEAMQQWLMDAQVDGTPVMPFLTSLRRRGVYFSQVFDQTGGSPTSDCEYLVMNSLHPLARGAVAFRRAANDFVAMPEVLRDHGYSTISAHAYQRGMWNRGVLHPAYGFSHSLFRRELGEEPKLGWGLADKPFFEKAAAALKNEPAPFFAFLISLTSHHPYSYIPAKERSINPKGAPRAIANYVQSARYVDESLQEFFDSLEKNGLAKNTAVIIYGDHDAKLKFSSADAKRAAAALQLPEQTMELVGRSAWDTDRIPLVLVPPPGAPVPAGEVVTVGGQIDIGATVMHYLGVESPASFLGLPLVPERAGAAARQDGSAVDQRLRLTNGTRCYERADEKSQPRKVCDALGKAADHELEISRRITMHDLATWLAPQHAGS